MSTKLDPITYFRNFTNVYFISVNKWQELTSFIYSLLLGQSQLKLQVSILMGKGPPKLCIECHLVPLWAFPPKSLGYFGRISWNLLVSSRYMQSSKILYDIIIPSHIFIFRSYIPKPWIFHESTRSWSVELVQHTEGLLTIRWGSRILSRSQFHCWIVPHACKYKRICFRVRLNS